MVDLCVWTKGTSVQALLQESGLEVEIDEASSFMRVVIEGPAGGTLGECFVSTGKYEEFRHVMDWLASQAGKRLAIHLED